jgi:hypothetical protein
MNSVFRTIVVPRGAVRIANPPGPVGFANSVAASTLSFFSRSARARLGLFVDWEVVLGCCLTSQCPERFGASIGETIERA